MTSLENEKLNQEIRRLIDELLRVRNNAGNNSIDQVELNADRMKNLKNFLRQNDQLLLPFFEHLLDNYLCKDNVVVRLYSIKLIDEIFQRSHRFRECVLDNFEEFLKYTAETDPLRHPLPAPKNLAKILKERTLRMIHDWYNLYGKAYRKLQVAYEYLKSCKTFDFQRIEAETIVERERSERERRRQEQTKERVVRKVTEDLQDFEDEMEKSLTEINNGFRLLIPEITNDHDRPTPDDDQPSTSSKPPSLHAHGVPTLKFDLSVKVNFNKPPVELDQDNIDLITNLKDCNKLIAGRFLPKIRQLLNVLSHYGGDETLTKTLIDWRVRLDEAKRKFDDLPLETTKSLTAKASASAIDDEDGDFEIVPEKEGLEEIFRPPSPDVPQHLRDWSKNDSVKPKKSAGVLTISSGREASSTNDDQRDERASVPIVPYGIDLEYWENEKSIRPMIVRSNADCHRFWRPPDGEDAIQCSDVEAAAYRTRVMEFVGKFEPIERECRAPLAGKEEGMLCKRRDRYRCPFHGFIVPRDEKGNRTDKADFPAAATDDSRPSTSKVFGDAELLKDIEGATGRKLTNVKKRKRETDTDVAAEASATRDRLQRKVFNRSSLKRVAATQSALDSAKQKKKFGGQWQYIFRDQ